MALDKKKKNAKFLGFENIPGEEFFPRQASYRLILP
jgi:hypothetical protein